MEGARATGPNLLPDSNRDIPPPRQREGSGEFSHREVTGSSPGPALQWQPSQAARRPCQGGTTGESLFPVCELPTRRRSIGSYVIKALKIVGVIVAAPLVIPGLTVMFSVTLAANSARKRYSNANNTHRICAILKGFAGGVLGAAGGLVIGPLLGIAGEVVAIRNIIVGNPVCLIPQKEESDNTHADTQPHDHENEYEHRNLTDDQKVMQAMRLVLAVCRAHENRNAAPAPERPERQD